MKYYSPTHEWVRCADRTGSIGITAFAKNGLGDVVYIEFPKIGRAVKAGEELCVLESTKSATDIYSPVSGKIIAVQTDLNAINQDAENSGWLVQIELSNPLELDHLLSKSEYDQSLHG